MAEIEKTEFEFPDEQEANPRKGGRVVEPETDEVKVEADDIEIVDDTPPEDRNRKPMKTAPEDVSDDELAKYDESVQKRIKHFTKGYHEERRAKEAAQREKEEALRIAQTIAEENKKLKGSLSVNQNALLEQAKKTVASELETAKRQYKEAYESGDSDRLVEAQEAMTTAKMRAERVNNFKPTPLQQDDSVVQTQQVQQPAQPVDPKLRDWTESNPWYGSNKRATAYALGLHDELVEEGVAIGSNEYYKRINADVRDRFPELFDSGKQEDAETPPTRKSNVVAPATRSTAPRKVVLTQTQVNIAKRLGVPLELYARKVAEEMRK